MINQHAVRPETSVPDWMLGAFQRESITFANGLSDVSTQVYWLQGRNQTIDLRLPTPQDLIHKNLSDCSREDLLSIANYEGWSANAHWDGRQLSWSGGESFQLYNRWPEAGVLQRVGNCMIEFSPSGAYVEDWRIRSISEGPLVSLVIDEEIEPSSGKQLHRGGALIITGTWAGLILGRSYQVAGADSLSNDLQLRDRVLKATDFSSVEQHLFNFEASIATGCIESGYTVQFSTDYARLGEPLFDLEGFEIGPQRSRLTHRFVKNNLDLERRYLIDTVETKFGFSASTGWSESSLEWFDREEQTLARYLDGYKS